MFFFFVLLNEFVNRKDRVLFYDVAKLWQIIWIINFIRDNNNNENNSNNNKNNRQRRTSKCTMNMHNKIKTNTFFFYSILISR